MHVSGGLSHHGWRIRRERGILSTHEPYPADVAPPVDVRRANFARWVKRVLDQAKAQRGLSVPQIAVMAGIGNQTIYRWRDGKGEDLPKPEQVLMFCDALDISPMVAFAILWPGKVDAPVPVEPIILEDENYRTLMRKLQDDSVPEFEKMFIRETMRQLADRPITPVKRARRKTAD